MLENALAPRLSLAGLWSFELAEQQGQIAVPGVWEMQGYSTDAVGPAVYRRAVEIPAAWDGARVFLCCGAVSYFTEALVNGQPVGTHEGLWTPFDLDITEAVRCGALNEIELRVTKPGRDGDPYPYRDVLVGFVPYVAMTFGGPWQDVYLTAHRAPAFSNVHLAPDWRTGTVRVSAAVVNSAGAITARAEICAPSGQVVVSAEQVLPVAAQTFALALTVPDHELWSPQTPTLYSLRLTLEQGGTTVTEVARRFGFRQLAAQGDQLLLNDQPVHLRGVLSWGWNPAALAPVFNDEEIRTEFRRLREHGFNLYKLCLYVPPPRLYEIADEEGMLLWLELPMWWQRLNEHLRQQAHSEYLDILARDHYHPSIVIYSLGCELGTDMADADLLSALDSIVRGTATGALVCDNSGSGEAYAGLTFDFADFSDYHFYCDIHNFNPLLDHFHRDWRPARPWIFGEFCDHDDYRPADCLTDDGVRPWWRSVYGIEGNPQRWAYAEQEARMAANALPFSDEQLVTISRRESFTVRKYVLEQTRLRRRIGGYVLTGLRDTPISTSGVFDDRGRFKFDPTAFRCINSDTVLLLERGRTRVWRNGGDRPAPIDLFNYWAGSSADLRAVLAHVGLSQSGGALRWQLTALGSDQSALHGELLVSLPDTSPAEIARLTFTLPPVETAQQWTLRLELGDLCSNEWPLWVYPPVPNWPADLMLHDPTGTLTGIQARPFDPHRAGILVTTMFSAEVQAFVRDGGRAVVLAQPDGGLPTRAVPFWRETIKLLYPHPLLAHFPHEGFAGLQFYHLATDYALDTQRFEQHIEGLTDARAIIRRLDARVFTLLDYMVELYIGAGRAVATTLRLAGGAGDQVSSLQASPAGRYLLAEAIAYLAQLK